MVKAHGFDRNDWAHRLGISLEVIAGVANYSLLLDGNRGPYLTRDEVLALHDGTNGGSAVRDAMASSYVQLAWDTADQHLIQAEQRDVLREHPILQGILPGFGDDKGLMLLGPNGAALVTYRDLLMRLARLSVVSSGPEAARLLDRYLTVGEARQLEAREIVVVYGLKLTGRIDLGNGCFLAPLDDRFITQEGFTEEESEKLKTFSVGRRDFRNDSGGSSVFVRDLNWGPGVAPVSDGRDIGSAEVSYSFPCSVETVVNLLSVAARCPLATSTRHIRLAKWMRNIQAGNEMGLWGSASFRLDGWWEECELSSEAEASFRKSLAGWTNFRFGSDAERDALSLATWRLSRSFTRLGGWELQDRILDYAIALEILYGLDSSELTYKLGTRAAYLLGKNPEKRREIFERVTEFYGMRSSIVHGARRKKHRNLSSRDYEEACANGRYLACETLFELLQRGCFPDWKDLVLTGPPL